MIYRSIAGFISAVAAVAAASSSNTVSGYDVVDDFCLRVYHQSVVKNGILYIDGGIEVFQHDNDQDTRVLGYNTKLIEVDMSSSWDWKQNISIKAVNKTANPATGSEPPLVVRGSLFAGPSTEPDIYLYGGTVSYANTSFPGWKAPASSAYSLWSYGTDDTTWRQYDVSRNASLIPAGGAHAEAPNLGLAFYLNGFIDNGTANQFGDWADFYSFLPGLVVVNTETQTATNLSTASLDRSPRTGGSMLYVENIGPQGVLVAMGGVTKPVSESSRADTGTYVTFDKIDFFDVSSVGNSSITSTWYTQKASGDIPKPRTDFCLTAVSAKDGSSHSIYLYGGKGADTHYDDVYILSLPSFTWTFLFEGQSPRWGHTCHLVAGHQMITVGGQVLPNPDIVTEDYLATCDWELKGVAIMDLSTYEWGSVYNATYADYEVPPVLYNIIGGDENGNATMLSPAGGWANSQSASFFNQVRPMANGTERIGNGTSSSSSNSNNSSSSSGGGKGLSGGGLAGAVVGSVAGAGAIIALVSLWVRHKRKQSAPGLESAGGEREKEGDPTNVDRGVELPAEVPAQLPGEGLYEMEGDSVRQELHGRHINELGTPSKLDNEIYPIHNP